MYKVLIADDEPIVRGNICRAIPWKQLGLILAGTAGNGREAAALACERHPDIILTDIMMPLLNGLELIKELQRSERQPIIAIITGYDEFDYARTAIKLGVFDYILKPVQPDLVCQMLSRAIAVLRSRDTASSELALMRRQLEEQGALQLQLDLQQFLLRRLDVQILRSHLPASIDPDGWFSCVLLQIDDYHHLTNALDEEHIFTLVLQIEDWLARDNGPLLLTEEIDGRYAMIFAGANEQAVCAARDSYLRRIRCFEPPYAYTTAGSYAVKGIGNLLQAHEQAGGVMVAAFLSSGDTDLTPADLDEKPEPFLPVDISSIIQSIPTLNKGRIKREFEAFEAEIRSAGHNSYLFTRLAINYVYSEIVHTLVALRCPISRIVNDPTRVYQNILQCQTLSGAMASLYDFVSQICDTLSDDIGSSNRLTVHEANAYLRANFQNPKLSLEETAATVNLSPNYFSSLYKQTTGRSFISSLTAIRIEKAKQLLASGQLRSYEVAYQCGYDNPTYFSTIFKRHTGLSPSEYSAMQMGRGENT